MKKALMYFFSVIMVFSCFSPAASALTEPGGPFTLTEKNGEKVLDLQDGNYYTYLGKLTSEPYELVTECDSKNTDETDGGYTVGKCFSVTSDKAGIYAVLGFGDENISSLFVSGITENIDSLFRDTEPVIAGENITAGEIFRMEADEMAYVTVSEFAEGTVDFRFVYLGEIVSAESACQLIRNADCAYIEEYDAIEMYPYVDLEFSEGESLTISSYAHGDFDINSGGGEVNISILGNYYPINIDMIDGRTMVEDISLPEGYVPEAVISYDGLFKDYVYPDYVKVTMTDGTSVNLAARGEEDDSVTLPNGRSYTIMVNFMNAEEYLPDELGEPTLDYDLCGIISKSEKVKIVPEKFSESVRSLITDSARDFRTGLHILRYGGEDVGTSDAVYFMTNLHRRIAMLYRFEKQYSQRPWLYTAVPVGAAVLLVLIMIISFFVRKKIYSQNTEEDLN